MTTFATLTWRGAVIGRWVARISGTLMVLFLLAFLIGEGLPPIGRMTARESSYAVGLFALFLGLALAWFWEGWGGLLSVLGWALLAVVAGRAPTDLPFSIPAAVGLLHLVCWWRLRGAPPSLEPASAAAMARLKILYVFLGLCLGAFILLSANEMFGNPPLMTQPNRPTAEMVGAWSDTHAMPVALTIAQDGSIAGMIGGADVIDGRLVSNRSWFGRLLHWRTDYLIQGRLSHTVESYGGAAGDYFCAPVNLSHSMLSGSLFLSHPGVGRPLGLRLRRR